MRSVREIVLDELEKAVRKTVATMGLGDKLKSDDEAMRWGACTWHLARSTKIKTATVRSALYAALADGLVLISREQPNNLHWWPVGLVEKMNAERGDA